MPYKINDRKLDLDLLRVVAILYIIGFWHLDDYLKPVNVLNSNLSSSLTLVALNTFIYISGFLLFKKYGSMSTKKEATTFLSKRFLRLYPLYLSALILFFITSMYDYKDSLCALFFCNIFITINISTLWFVSLILSYYLLIPIMSLNYSVKRTLFISAILFISTIIIHENYNILGRALIEKRFILYLPSFILGILSAKHEIILKFLKNKLFAFIATGFFIATVYNISLFRNPWDGYLNLTMYMSISPLLIISEHIAPKINQQLLLKLSYAAFCMYLYHRVIYWFLLQIYQPKSNILIAFYLICIGLPIIYVISKYIQSRYDFYLKKYFPSMT